MKPIVRDRAQLKSTNADGHELVLERPRTKEEGRCLKLINHAFMYHLLW